VVCQVPDVVPLQIALCEETVAWTRETTRTFLRQRIEVRLANLFLVSKKYEEALDAILKLNREVKKLDDKLLLVDIQLVESRIQHMLTNMPKAKAALTAARTSANAIYCPPKLQTQLDMQSGVLHAEEKDYKTGYSYFFEAFEGLSTMDENATAKLAAIQAKAEHGKLSASQSVLQVKAAAQDAKAQSLSGSLHRSQSQVLAQQQSSSESPRDAAARALKYMLLCKIMTDNSTDVDAIIASKGALRYAGDGIEAMRALAHAHRDRSLKLFEEAKDDFAFEVEGDEIVRRHMDALYDTLLEQNIERVVEPFSVVETERVAALVGLPVDRIESKLSQMILDHKLNGILDQAEGHLRLFEAEDADEVYDDALATVGNLGDVVDSLYAKANKHL
jgi:26S proteasome regulatory subunit N6